MLLVLQEDPRVAIFSFTFSRTFSCNLAAKNQTAVSTPALATPVFVLIPYYTRLIDLVPTRRVRV